MRPRPPDHLSEVWLGYRIHTNRELGMMLRREKPPSVFTEMEGAFQRVLLRYLRMFDQHAEAGGLVKREHSRRNVSTWTKEHERREGALLGYTDAQNDAWIASRYSAEDGAP